LGDGDGVVSFAILSGGYFVPTSLTDARVVNAVDPARSVFPTNSYSQLVDGDSTPDLVVEFASSDLLAEEIVTKNATNVMLIGESDTETVVGIVSGLGLPQAGFVPDGGFQIPGAPLMIKKAGTAGNLKVVWGDSCVEGDTDYAVYEGVLGAPGSHRPVVCGTNGVTAANFAAGPGDHYYLVVPLNPEGVEGSYGSNSIGVQRAQGTPLVNETNDVTACAPQIVAQSCGM
jgi:hypothetical protein